MAKIYLVSLTMNIPVSADSAQEAMEFVEHNTDLCIDNEAKQAYDALQKGDEAQAYMECTELKVEDLDDADGFWTDIIPWGDDSMDSIGQRMGILAADAYEDQDEESSFEDDDTDEEDDYESPEYSDMD